MPQKILTVYTSTFLTIFNFFICYGITKPHIAHSATYLSMVQSKAIKCLLLFFLLTMADDGLSQTLTPNTSQRGEYFDIADSLHKTGQYDSAIHYYHKASDLYQAYGEWEDFIKSQSGLGSAVGMQGNYEQGLAILKKTLHSGIKYLGKENITVALSYYYLGIIYKKMHEYDQGLIHYQKALDIYIDQLGEQDLKVAKLYNNMGNIYWHLGQYNRAQEYHQKVLNTRISQLGELHLDVAYAYDNIGNDYLKQGQYHRSLSHYQKALEIRTFQLGEKHSDVASSLNNIGALYWLLGQYNQAMTHYQKGLNISIGQLGEKHLEVANAYHNMGLIYYSLGEYDHALSYSQKALSIHINELGENHLNMANSYDNIGAIYGKLAQYDRALSYHEKSQNIRINLLGKEHPDMADSYDNIGLSYWRLNQNDRALDYYQKALEIRINQLGETHPDVANSYNNIGIIYRQAGQHKQALTHYQKALDNYINRLGKSHPGLANPYNNIGEIYKRLSQYSRAMNYYQKALNIRKKALGENHPWVADSYNAIAEVYSKQGLYDKSLAYYQKALQCNVPGFNTTDIAMNPTLIKYLNGSILLASLTGKAEVLATLSVTSTTDALQHSLQTYQLCDTLINQLRQAAFRESDKIALSDKAVEVYTGAIGVILSLKKKENVPNDELLPLAFYFSEQNKAMVLFGALQEYDAKHFAGIPDSLLEREKTLKERQAFYRKKLTKKTDSTGKVGYQNQLFQLHQDQEILIAQLEAQYPNYYQLKYETHTASITQIQQALEEKSALIEYFLGDSALYIFTISAETVNIQHFQLPPIFNTTLQQLIKMLTTYPDGIKTAHSDYEAYAKAAYLLYNWLLEKPLTQLPSTIEKLLIVPDGALSYLNFAALVTTLPETIDPHDVDFSLLSYLIKDYQVSYAVSATLWSINQTSHHTSVKKHIAKHTFGGFAPEYPKLFATDSMLPKMVAQLVRDGEMPLPGARKEVQDIADIMDGDAWTGIQAGEGAFKQKASEYKILHLAMHALIDDNDPMHSSFVFTPKQDSIEDNYLHASEIYTMQINADLAVLSACNSGSGSLKKGEGIMSLSRAFMYAGCSAQVMSLWKVSDLSSKKIMTDFYKNLKKEKTIDASLRDAQLSYLTEIGHPQQSHPFFWASFIPIGNMNPIDMRSENNVGWTYTLIISITVLLTFGLWKILITKKNKLTL